MNRLKNQDGVSIFELLATIIVASIVTMILMQILVLTVRARVELETENRLLSESYIISEQLTQNIFNLEPQQLQLISDTASQTVIEIRHLYDYSTNASNVIIEVPNYIVDTILLDKTTGNLYYNGTQVNKNGVVLGTNTAVTLISVNPTLCDLSASAACDQGFIELSLEIIIQLPSGETLAPKIYVTKILV